MLLDSFDHAKRVRRQENEDDGNGNGKDLEFTLSAINMHQNDAFWGVFWSAGIFKERQLHFATRGKNFQFQNGGSYAVLQGNSKR